MVHSSLAFLAYQGCWKVHLRCDIPQSSCLNLSMLRQLM